VDVYLTGSTAFRANAYVAATKLFASAPTIYYGSAANGGADSGFSSSTASWVMTGTPITGITNLAGKTLVVHGLFTGSIQGVQGVESGTKLKFPAPSGTANGLCNAYVTNTATMAFDDASASVTPYPATGNYAEEAVAVIPFFFAKSQAGGVMTNINNVSWEQVRYGIPQGRIPLSAWTAKQSDTNTFIYLMQRTLDSGTRRAETACSYYTYGDTVGVYLYDKTNNFFYLPTTNLVNAFATSPNGVVGTAGLGNVNLNWGYGYVAGSDIKNTLNLASVSNTAIGYISFSDGKGVGASNYANVLPFNGVWPTAEGVGILNGQSLTNDFSPITQGYYPLWSELALIHIIDPSLAGDQNISQSQLGNNTTPGSFLGVFNAQTKINGGSPLVGSIEKEVVDSQTSASKAGGATAIPLRDMKCSRQSVGGTITPF
jgi:hypothetical protein